ncbi:MAG: phage tail protein [Actinobacteria bacterium]|nr:phage tail protein [Actinomycetota bacterium]
MTTGLLTTTLGSAAMTADLGGGTDLALTHVAFGDANGVPYMPNAAQTALVNEKYRATIASVAAVAGALVIDVIIPADTPDGSGRASHGFNVAEAGLFNSAGTMIGVARMSNGYKPPPSSGQATIATFRLKLAVSNPSAITVVIDPQAQVNIGRQVRPFWLAVEGVLNAPPGAPAVGATYVIGAAPTGAWTGFAHRLADWGGGWALSTAPVGHHVCDASKALDASDRYLRRTADGWTSAQAAADALGVVQLATLAEALAGTDNVKAITARVLRAARFRPVPWKRTAPGSYVYTVAAGIDLLVLEGIGPGAPAGAGAAGSPGGAPAGAGAGCAGRKRLPVQEGDTIEFTIAAILPGGTNAVAAVSPPDFTVLHKRAGATLLTLTLSGGTASPNAAAGVAGNSVPGGSTGTGWDELFPGEPGEGGKVGTVAYGGRGGSPHGFEWLGMGGQGGAGNGNPGSGPGAGGAGGGGTSGSWATGGASDAAALAIYA